MSSASSELSCPPAPLHLALFLRTRFCNSQIPSAPFQQCCIVSTKWMHGRLEPSCDAEKTPNRGADLHLCSLSSVLSSHSKLLSSFGWPHRFRIQQIKTLFPVSRFQILDTTSIHLHCVITDQPLILEILIPPLPPSLTLPCVCEINRLWKLIVCE